MNNIYYMGGKIRIADEILEIILKDREKDQYFVEPFCGGCNTIYKVDGPRIAADIHEFLITLWKAIQEGWIPPEFISRDEFYQYRDGDDPLMEAYSGFICSYRGVWRRGYAQTTKNKNGYIRNYQNEARRALMKQVDGVKGIEFYNCEYQDLYIPPRSIIYCDPPYQGSSGYYDGHNRVKFDSVTFWVWCRQMSDAGHTVFVSEYKAPPDFHCVWEKKVTNKLDIKKRDMIGGKKVVERLFTI